MFLKRLESIGFKSFAERIKVEFVSGVTAVVGPNGSGKSNVIDAVRWVLGEQSAKSLRGQKMEDIIFQGSDTRKALNFAEVSLILNNEQAALPIDYQEVDVTRRVYRSGESEFFLNKQACRLKDIVDLFMDTGLGKESFSIIGQGRIDEILSSKAEDRRAIFEEAAGVLKYKQRKKQASSKLLDTADNLDRVEDILHEITQQIEPLAQQAKTAHQYHDYQNRLTEIEISLLITQIEQLYHTWQHALSGVEVAEKDTQEKRTAIQKREAMLTKDRETLQALEKDIAERQQTRLEMTEQLKQHEGERDVILEKGKYERENKEKLEQEQNASMSRLRQLESQFSKEKIKLEKATTETKHIQQQVEKLEQALTVTPDELTKRIEDMKADYIECLNEQAITKNEMQRIERQTTQLERQKETQQHTYQSSLAVEQKLAADKNELIEKRDVLKEQIVNLEATREAVQTELAKNRTSFEDMQQKLFTGNEQIAKYTSKKEMLEEMKDSYQGFYYGAKEVLKAKDRGILADVMGAVLDLISIPSEYMIAMETVLGGQAQYIVVEDDKAARQAINWLKQENKGRATFLPLASIVPKQLPTQLYQSLQNQSGFIGVAADLIETDSVYVRLKEYLLGNVLVTKDIRHANEIAKITHRKFRIVTLEGDIVFPGGSMSGGAKKQKNQSLFTREKEILTLTAKLKDFTKRANDFEQQLLKQREKVQHLESNEKKNLKIIEEIKTQLDHVQSELHDISVQYSREKTEVHNYQLMTEQYEEEHHQLQQQHAELMDKEMHIKREIADKDKQMEQLSNQQKTLEQDEKETEHQLQDLKIKQAEQTERKKAMEERYYLLQKECKDTTLQSQKIAQELTTIMDEADREVFIQALQQKISTLQQEKTNIFADLQEYQQKKETLLQQTRDAENETKGIQQALDRAIETLQKKEVEVNRLDVTIENHLNRLQSTYKTTYERARQTYEPVENIKQASEKVETLTAAIERLGTVNLGSIDELERLQERETFLSEQQADLLEAKGTLEQVIQEMDSEMTRRFSGVFQEIQHAFSNVFQQLFGGGQASLTLTNPEDLLETGIDIAARPPGKKLKTLELLSGGERALTAIALLFAILHARPVPFCILDEVDAALDEANVERFGKFLQNFSEHTQFIVITHRKGTMSEADALYGITMQESGVSRLVSVKLEETDTLVATS